MRITVAERFIDYAEEVADGLAKSGLRYEIAYRAEKIGYNIHSLLGQESGVYYQRHKLFYITWLRYQCLTPLNFILYLSKYEFYIRKCDLIPRLHFFSAIGLQKLSVKKCPVR
ncbi:MAG TPA: hypothetical protein DEG06_03005 [Lachnospiraceae bacterium]|nr:hypothetical protein [Lachnospiraceae bacterium]HBY71189.1 hypothetical protein [Lachnospiraceae bacterium]HCM12267.1 hypothetical protein [Lachnospiraceae bacterium]HCR40928.1 hypothetical protein [Lachnospiraceae bacterium]